LKILRISYSPRSRGNTEILAHKAVESAKKEGDRKHSPKWQKKPQLRFDDFGENAGFVNFNDSSIQPELIEQFGKLVTADSSGFKTILA